MDKPANEHREFLRLCEFACASIEIDHFGIPAHGQHPLTLMIDGEELPKLVLFNENNLLKPALMLHSDKLIKSLGSSVKGWGTSFVKLSDSLVGISVDSKPSTANWLIKTMCMRESMKMMSEVNEETGVLDFTQGINTVGNWVLDTGLKEGDRFKSSSIEISIGDVAAVAGKHPATGLDIDQMDMRAAQ